MAKKCPKGTMRRGTRCVSKKIDVYNNPKISRRIYKLRQVAENIDLSVITVKEIKNKTRYMKQLLTEINREAVKAKAVPKKYKVDPGEGRDYA